MTHPRGCKCNQHSPFRWQENHTATVMTANEARSIAQSRRKVNLQEKKRTIVFAKAGKT